MNMSSLNKYVHYAMLEQGLKIFLIFLFIFKFDLNTSIL